MRGPCLSRATLCGLGSSSCSCLEIPQCSRCLDLRGGRVAVRSIEAFLHSWGWQLGEHSAVYNSAYVHCSRGLWVSQKGRSLGLCPHSQQGSQLYGNGCWGGGGAPPPRNPPQSVSAQTLESQGAGLPCKPLNPDSTRSFCCDSASRSAAAWLSLAFILLASSPRRDPGEDPKPHPPVPAQPGALRAPPVTASSSPPERGGSQWAALAGSALEGHLRSRMVTAIACCVSLR